ncbi:NAD(P)-binding protein [Bimuria novae-zelandiae CBS 107.79]|uniref:NAD(P)-binding protein n=1 Tax=Bimuria novae-zelandiae CBS 107.79 TaxID=1447943 RepID=A0A6A5V2H7_9PLEO|nr:NAD(P)-binding protein [Bimuria novae-zelandiae CBS 107.79]
MSQKESVLLTGATGNVGGVILEHLLEKTPHDVNIVLRNAAKQIPLFRKRFPKETSSNRLKFTSVPDMTAPGAFDTAAASATAIIHCATPVGSENNDWIQDMVVPTWTIDHNMLTAAQKSSTVKRVIICGTLLQALGPKNLFDPSATITDASYNTTTFEEAKAGPWQNAYMYSKTNAEHKTWAWYEENGGKEGTGFDIVMTLPPMITGRSPQVGWKPSGSSPGGIGRIWSALLETKTAADMDATFPIFMDTDDVARVHVLSLDAEKVPGNWRYLLVSPEIVDVRSVAARMRKEYPELADRLPDVEVDAEGYEKKKAKLAKMDTSKSDEIFGTEWKSAYDSIKEIVLDTVRFEKESRL